MITLEEASKIRKGDIVRIVDEWDLPLYAKMGITKPTPDLYKWRGMLMSVVREPSGRCVSDGYAAIGCESLDNPGGPDVDFYHIEIDCVNPASAFEDDTPCDVSSDEDILSLFAEVSA